MTTDQTAIDVVTSIRLNGVLLLTVLTHVEEGEQLRYVRENVRICS